MWDWENKSPYLEQKQETGENFPFGFKLLCAVQCKWARWNLSLRRLKNCPAKRPVCQRQTVLQYQTVVSCSSRNCSALGCWRWGWLRDSAHSESLRLIQSLEKSSLMRQGRTRKIIKTCKINEMIKSIFNHIASSLLLQFDHCLRNN